MPDAPSPVPAFGAAAATVAGAAAPPCVMLATPCFGGMVHQGYMQSVLGLMRHCALHGIGLSLEMLGHDSLISRSRNTLLGRFLASPQATHLLFVDADITFEPAQVERLLRAGKEVVAGMYPLKVHHWDNAATARAVQGEAMGTAPLLYVGQPLPEAEREQDGVFVTASYAGTGFMLIRRDAVLRLIAAHPETRYYAIHAYPPRPEASAHYALFDCMIDPASGTYLSEDYTFCQRWRALGRQVWLDTAGRLTHVGQHDFAGNPALRFPLPAIAPAQAGA